MTLLEQLLKQLAATGADSPEVKALLGAIGEHEPNSAAIADTLVVRWRGGQRTSRLPDLSWAQWGALGGGVGVLAAVPWLQPVLLWAQQNIPLPQIESPVALLFVIALVGGLAGAAYSIYCNRGLVLPMLATKANVLTLSRLGILNEIIFGALAAITTIWLATIGLGTTGPASLPSANAAATVPSANPAVPEMPAAPPADPALPTAAVTPPENLLTWSVLLATIASGLVGARMRTAKLEQSLLQEALAFNVSQPAASERLGAEVRAAAPARAAQVATGMEVVGVGSAVLSPRSNP